MTFGSSTAVTPLGEGCYRLDVDSGWGIGTRANGGWLLAGMARAALAEAAGADPSPSHPHPLAVSAHYLRAPVHGPAEVSAEVLRRGRTVSALRARLCQDGRPCIEMLLTAGRLQAGAPVQASLPPAEPPTPIEACLANNPHPSPDLHVALLDRLEVRLDPAVLRRRTLELAGWITEQATPSGAALDPLFLLLACDAFPPLTVPLGRPGWAPTIELTCLVRALPSPGPLWARVSGRLLAEDLFDEDATIYDSTGRLVAQSRQLALAPHPPTAGRTPA